VISAAAPAGLDKAASFKRSDVIPGDAGRSRDDHQRSRRCQPSDSVHPFEPQYVPATALRARRVQLPRALREFGNSEHASAPFLGIGDPVLTGAAGRTTSVTLASLFRGATADVEKVRALPPLPETAAELHAIGKTLGASEADLLLGARASEPVLGQMSLDRYRIIEFATHGLVSGELKGLTEPALVLTPPAQARSDDDGLLTASEIATLKLNADWVVLSACNTAAGDGTPDGGGLSGLAKAFFYAGARSLLVSHWRAWSGATVKLTTGTFAELASDPSIGRAEALRRAMMAMLDPQSSPEFAHPLAWATFVLAGEGGAGR